MRCMKLCFQVKVYRVLMEYDPEILIGGCERPVPLHAQLWGYM
jgi:hypothetical protein